MEIHNHDIKKVAEATGKIYKTIKNKINNMVRTLSEKKYKWKIQHPFLEWDKDLQQQLDFLAVNQKNKKLDWHKRNANGSKIPLKNENGDPVFEKNRGNRKKPKYELLPKTTQNRKILNAQRAQK